MWTTTASGLSEVEDAMKQLLPPCQIKCPIDEDIQRTNVLISMLPEDIETAKAGILQIGNYLYEKNPLFNVCSYICGLCELECNYKNKGGAVRRRLLKRFLSNYFTDYLNEKEEFNTLKDRENVAVVGGGPGGLMCAYTLSKRGYRVTIFEAANRLGGALWLIPEYRLPANVIKTTVENLVRIAGIDVKYGSRVGDGKLTVNKLRNEGYKAVFLATGTPYPRVLTFGPDRVEGQDLSGVMYGLDFLYEVSHGNIQEDYFKNKKVCVIGGGNVAFDVARTTRRLGGEVTLMSLECEDKSSKDGIPADKEEIRAAWEEGIRIVYSHGVRKIIGKGGAFKAIDCPKCTSVYTDGAFNPQFDAADSLEISGDVLIITIGQMTDRSFLQKEGLLDQKGRMSIDSFTLQSHLNPMVFIGGDMRRIGFMAEAMKEGVEAAETIDRYLRGQDIRRGRKKEYEGFDMPLRPSYKLPTEVAWIPPEKRLHFQLFERGLTLKEAKEEAKRCVTCGPCLSCKACISIGFEKSLYAVKVNEERCCGCGICVYACNYSAAHLIIKDGKTVSATDNLFKCKSCGMCVAACPSEARELVDDSTSSKIAKVYEALTI
jgi:NADPH-dependent glutamate synthase beta subunit-like oxidoreductase/NAD-dependent dihydropyrimidine dehydrogenase PreA subunit